MTKRRNYVDCEKLPSNKARLINLDMIIYLEPGKCQTSNYEKLKKKALMKKKEKWSVINSNRIDEKNKREKTNNVKKTQIKMHI